MQNFYTSEAYIRWSSSSSDTRSAIIQNNTDTENKKLMVEIIEKTMSHVVQSNPFCFFKKNSLVVLLATFKEQPNYYQLLLSDEVRKSWKSFIGLYHARSLNTIVQVYENIESHEHAFENLPFDVFDFDYPERMFLYVERARDLHVPYQELPPVLRDRLYSYLIEIVNTAFTERNTVH